MFIPARQAGAQDLFAPVVRVGDRVVTAYEVEQRARFIELLGSPGDPRDVAISRLIDERLQLTAAKSLGIETTEEEITVGLEEFAARTELSAAEFIQRIATAGVDEVTFRDFVRAGVTWRKVVQARFAGQIALSADEVDRAIAIGPGRPSLRVLLSEIFLPARTPEEAAAAEAKVNQLTRIRGIEAFAQTARDISAAPSRDRGGEIDWVDLADLPPGLQGQLLAMRPGELTTPLRLPNAWAIFQLRAVEEVPAPKGPTVVDFARLSLAPGQDAAGALARADTCDDLYGLFRDLPEDRLLRETLSVSALPAELALDLARLDAGEYVLRPAASGATEVLMLCARIVTDAEGEPPSRDEVASVLRARKFEAAADHYLAELRARTKITRFD